MMSASRVELLRPVHADPAGQRPRAAEVDASARAGRRSRRSGPCRRRRRGRTAGPCSSRRRRRCRGPWRSSAEAGGTAPMATSPMWRMLASPWASPPRPSPDRSAPEQKSPPAPVSTRTRSSALARDLAEHGEQLVPHHAVGGVLPLRTVHRDRDDPVGPLDQQRLEAHAADDTDGRGLQPVPEVPARRPTTCSWPRPSSWPSSSGRRRFRRPARSPRGGRR